MRGTLRLLIFRLPDATLRSLRLDTTTDSRPGWRSLASLPMSNDPILTGGETKNPVLVVRTGRF